MTYEKKYFDKEKQYIKGEITEEEWKDFCTLFLELILEDNKDILKNLKGEW